MSYSHGNTDDLFASEKTIGLEPIKRLIAYANRNVTKTEDDLILNWVTMHPELVTAKLFAEIKKPNEIYTENVTGLQANEYDILKPRYSKLYEILHDDSQAAGLTFPKGNRMFGGGAQSDGIGGIRLDSDDIQFTEYTVAFWLKMALAENSGELDKKCPIGFLNEAQFDMTVQTNANAFNTNVLVFYPNGQTVNPMPYEFIPNVWQHHVLTAKGGEQCVYLDGVKVEFAAGVGQIPIINTTSKRAEIFSHFSRGYSPLAAGDKMAWVSICKGVADQDWVTKDYNGTRDFSDDSPVEEITTIPFVNSLKPQPNTYSGLFRV